MLALMKVATDTIAYVIGPTRLYDRPEVRFLNPGDQVWNDLDLAIRQLRMQGNMVDFQGQKSNGGIYKVEIRGGLLAGTEQVPGQRYRILKDGVRATLLEQMGGINKQAESALSKRIHELRRKVLGPDAPHGARMKRMIEGKDPATGAAGWLKPPGKKVPQPGGRTPSKKWLESYHKKVMSGDIFGR